MVVVLNSSLPGASPKESAGAACLLLMEETILVGRIALVKRWVWMRSGYWLPPVAAWVFHGRPAAGSWQD